MDNSFYTIASFIIRYILLAILALSIFGAGVIFFMVVASGALKMASILLGLVAIIIALFPLIIEAHYSDV